MHPISAGPWTIHSRPTGRLQIESVWKLKLSQVDTRDSVIILLMNKAQFRSFRFISNFDIISY